MRALKTVVLPFLLGLVLAGISAAENPALSSVSLNSANVVGGNSVLGAVTLNTPAPPTLKYLLRWTHRVRPRYPPA